MNLCKCDYAKVENDNGRSTTFFFVCQLTNEPTDPERCRRCHKKTQMEKVRGKDVLR